jgi:hypothetical protein
LDDNVVDPSQVKPYEEQEVSATLYTEENGYQIPPANAYLDAAITAHEASKNQKNIQATRNGPHAPRKNPRQNGIKVVNGHYEPDIIHTKTIDGLQTTEI